jgi:hypothetical protein
MARRVRAAAHPPTRRYLQRRSACGGAKRYYLVIRADLSRADSAAKPLKP